MALNRNKPYGEVCGTGVQYRYEQDGKYFDQHGNEVTIDGKPVKGGEAEQLPPQPLPNESIEDEPLTKGDFAQVEESSPVPETEIPAVSGADVEAPEPESLEDLTISEIKDMLDRMDVKYRAATPKVDLLAMLRDELAQREIEAGQE